MILQPLIRTRRLFRLGRGAQCRLGCGPEISVLAGPLPDLVGKRHCPLSPVKSRTMSTRLPTGERVRVRGNCYALSDVELRMTAGCGRQAPSSGLSATFSPDLGGEGTCGMLESLAAVEFVTQSRDVQLSPRLVGLPRRKR